MGVTDRAEATACRARSSRAALRPPAGEQLPSHDGDFGFLQLAHDKLARLVAELLVSRRGRVGHEHRLINLLGLCGLPAL